MSGLVEVTANQFPTFPYDEDDADDLMEENQETWDAERGLLGCMHEYSLRCHRSAHSFSSHLCML